MECSGTREGPSAGRKIHLDFTHASVKTSVEVKYAGRYFRSMIEARYAVFFDLLGVAWQYEPRTFFSRRERLAYKPDMYLPEYRYWVELKGAPPTPREQRKIAILRGQLRRGERLFVLVGQIPGTPEELEPDLVFQSSSEDIQRALNIARGWNFIRKGRALPLAGS